jgi:hypothetical protein
LANANAESTHEAFNGITKIKKSDQNITPFTEPYFTIEEQLDEEDVDFVLEVGEADEFSSFDCCDC